MLPAAIVMAGGRGSRMGVVAKPLLRPCRETMLEHVARIASEIASSVVVAASRHTLPALKRLCPRLPVDACIELGGRGYPEDLRLALNALRARPVLILPADTPLVTRDTLEWFTREAEKLDADIVTLVVRGRGPIGVSLVRSNGWRWANIETDPAPSLLNVNTWRDYLEAARLCSKSREAGA